MEELDLHITNQCNLRCSHCCFNSGRYPMPELPTAKIFDLLQEAVSLGAQEIHITGGEPFLRPDIFTILEAAQANGVNTRIQTNGTLLNQEILLRLKALGIHELMISLDGPEPVNDNIRGRGTYQKAWQAICQAHDLGIPVRVNSVVMQSNRAYIPELLQQTVQLGVKIHSFFHFTPMGAGSHLPQEVVPQHEWLAFLADIGERVRTWEVCRTRVILEQVYVDRADIRATDTLGCRIGFKKYCQVLCHGSVSPCTFLLYTGLFLGTVWQDSLRRIWTEPHNWEKYAAYMAMCSPCAHFDLCQGGCWLYSFYQNQKFARDPRCDGSGTIIPICPYLKRNAHGGVIVHSTADAAEGKGDVDIDGPGA
jgi:radical SAM protein with 4Fe4S-binding SPASM domain